MNSDITWMIPFFFIPSGKMVADPLPQSVFTSIRAAFLNPILGNKGTEPSASIALWGLIRNNQGLGLFPSWLVTFTELAVSATWGTLYFFVTLALTARVGELPTAPIKRSILSFVTNFSAALTDCAGSLAPSSINHSMR